MSNPITASFVVYKMISLCGVRISVVVYDTLKRVLLFDQHHRA